MNILPAARNKNNIYIMLVVFLYIFFIGYSPCYALSERDLQNPTILADEGWKYLWRGGTENFNKAEEFFQKAISLDSYNADAYAGFGALTMRRGHRPFKEYNKDQCRKALEFIEKAVLFNNRSIRAHYHKGEALICIEDYDGAIREAEMIEVLDNHVCLPHFLKSKAYKGKIKRKKHSSNQHMAIVEATDYLECAQNIRSSSEIADGFTLLRDLLIVTKDYASTATYFKRNIELKPYSMWSYYNYYWLLISKTDAGYLDSTDVPEAEKTINEAKTVVNHTIGTLWEIRFKRGEKYFALKQYDKALLEYTECLVAFPNYSITKERMSYICSQFTDRRCVAAWQKIIWAYLDRGNCSEALKVFNLQYNSHPQLFEQLKGPVLLCNEK